MRYLITPFDSVEQWIKNNNVSFDKRLDHIEEIDIAPGDHIIGQLDIQQMKMLNRKRANYEHLLVDWPKDISAEQVTPELIESLNVKNQQNLHIHCRRRTFVYFKEKDKNKLACLYPLV